VVDNDRRCHARKTPFARTASLRYCTGPEFFFFLLHPPLGRSACSPRPRGGGLFGRMQEEPTTIRSIFKVFELAWVRVPDSEKRLSPEPFHVILEKSSVVVGVERCIEEPRGVPPSSSWTKRHPPNSGPVSHNIHIGQVSFQNAAGGFHPLQVHIERHRRIIQSPIHARQSFRLAGSSIETINASRHPPPAIAKTIAKLMRIM
jgi:hypothetical protein